MTGISRSNCVPEMEKGCTIMMPPICQHRPAMVAIAFIPSGLLNVYIKWLDYLSTWAFTMMTLVLELT